MVIDEKLAQNDVVISSRIRLARNIADFPFVNTCSDDQRQQIESTVRNELHADDALNELTFLDSLELEALERQFLLDLQLICPEDATDEDGSKIESTQSTDPISIEPITEKLQAQTTTAVSYTHLTLPTICSV